MKEYKVEVVAVATACVEAENEDEAWDEFCKSRDVHYLLGTESIEEVE